MAVKTGGDLVVLQSLFLCCVNQVVIMLTSLHLNEKNREFCIKAMSPTALLAFVAR